MTKLIDGRQSMAIIELDKFEPNTQSDGKTFGLFSYYSYISYGIYNRVLKPVFETLGRA